MGANALQESDIAKFPLHMKTTEKHSDAFKTSAKRMPRTTSFSMKTRKQT
jgi:hypothetical protein